MAKALLFLALAASAAGSEVEDLGSMALGATTKTGGFFSALQTSGAFTMMQAGGFEERALGEVSSAGAVAKSPAQCLPGGTLQCAKVVQCPGLTQEQCTGSTKGEVQRAKEAAAAAAKAAKDELKAKQLAKAEMHAAVLLQEEGVGKWQDPVTGDTVACDTDCPFKETYDTCPDNLSTGKFWMMTKLGAVCQGMTHKIAVKGLPQRWDQEATGPQIPGIKNGDYIITKARMFMIESNNKVGGMVMKRQRCTSDGRCSVFKIGMGINCESVKPKFNFGVGTTMETVKVGKLIAFVKNCVAKAFGTDGRLKASFALNSDAERKEISTYVMSF